MKDAIKKPVFYSGGGDSVEKPFRYDSKTRSVSMDGHLWSEFDLLGHLIRDSIILRWAEETARMAKGTVRISDVFALLVTTTLPERDVFLAREAYTGAGNLECVWSGQRMRTFDVDHAIPFSLWRDNSLWNLLPVLRTVNNRKRDKLPSGSLLNERRDPIIHYWEIMKKAYSVRFFRDITKIGTHRHIVEGNWKEPLFAGFVEAVETTAVRRGVERWSI